MVLSPYIVVPMKSSSHAKSRLRGELSDAYCSKLAKSMFTRTIRLVRGAFRPVPLLVVTASPEIAQEAREHGCEVLAEASEQGLNAAARRAAEWGCRNGRDTLLLIHADIPLLQAGDVKAMLAAVSTTRASAAICRSLDGGTNMLAVNPPDLLPFRFGQDSYRRYVAEAKALGVPVADMKLPRAERDIDTIEDLRTFSDAEVGHGLVLAGLPAAGCL